MEHAVTLWWFRFFVKKIWVMMNFVLKIMNRRKALSSTTNCAEYRPLTCLKTLLNKNRKTLKLFLMKFRFVCGLKLEHFVRFSSFKFRSIFSWESATCSPLLIKTDFEVTSLELKVCCGMFFCMNLKQKHISCLTENVEIASKYLKNKKTMVTLFLCIHNEKSLYCFMLFLYSFSSSLYKLFK